jgi:hypothetical protein
MMVKKAPPLRRPQFSVKKSDIFHISFDTKDPSGYLRAVRVILSEDIVMDDETVSINLTDHPLYLKLQEYVKANPR